MRGDGAGLRYGDGVTRHALWKVRVRLDPIGIVPLRGDIAGLRDRDRASGAVCLDAVSGVPLRGDAACL